jgi:hypothetical protein
MALKSAIFGFYHPSGLWITATDYASSFFPL